MKTATSYIFCTLSAIYMMLMGIMLFTLGCTLFTDKGQFLHQLWFIRFHYIIAAALCMALPVICVYIVASIEIENNTELGNSIDQAAIARDKYIEAEAKMQELIRELSAKK